MDQGTQSRTGTRFGKYQIGRMLGRGGMGEVYEAVDTTKDRTVALKILVDDISADDDFRERFAREAQVAARLQEPHVIPIHDWGEIDGCLYIDMRLVKGSTLRDVLASGPLQPARAVKVCGQIAEALDAAHAEGLIHRDVKPANIVLTAGDFPYLLDFGIAKRVGDTKLTQTGMTVGSISYIAPERLNGYEATAAVDEYALACVLYECLTGHAPFMSKNMAEVMTAHLYTPPPRASIANPRVPPALDEVIARGMSKNPVQRYQGTGAFARAAEQALSQLFPQVGGPVRPAQGAPPPQPPRTGASVSAYSASPTWSPGWSPTGNAAPGTPASGRIPPPVGSPWPGRPSPPFSPPPPVGWSASGTPPPPVSFPPPRPDDNKRLAAVLLAGAAALVALIIVLVWALSSGGDSEGEGSAPGVVRGYLDALARGDAKGALGYGVDRLAADALLADEILKKQVAKWPISDVRILTDGSRLADGRVHVSAKFGRQVSDATLTLTKSGGRWRLVNAAVKLTLNGGPPGNKALETLTVFERAASAPLLVFPGWVDLRSANANLVATLEKPVLLEALVAGNAQPTNVNLTLTDDVGSVIPAAVAAALSTCLTSHQLAPPDCPQALGGQDLVDGTAAWGRPDTSGMRVTSVDAYRLQARLAGDVVFPLSCRTRSGRTWQGSYTGFVAGNADFAQSPPTVDLV